MNYNTLSAFRTHLERHFKNKNTSDYYFFAVKRAFSDFDIEKFSDITPEVCQKLLKSAKSKKHFSALKCGLKQIKSFDPDFVLPPKSEVDEIAAKKKSRSFRPKKEIVLDTVNRKVNALKDQKFKLAYRLMEVSGLRVAECAKLTPKDIKFGENGDITVKVDRGKGGKSGVVKCLPDKYLSEKLPGYIEEFNKRENTGNGSKLFPKAQILKNKAVNLGLECHNFRRIAAITFRQRQRLAEIGEDGETVKEPYEISNEKTKDFLRHERFATTKRYLYNRKLVFKEDPAADETPQTQNSHEFECVGLGGTADGSVDEEDSEDAEVDYNFDDLGG